eukprot:scaffold46564_cov21-Phaeocystis_antarctica.AAC.1
MPSTLQMRRPRNSMHCVGPRRLCGAHWMPNSASSSSNKAHPRRHASSSSPTSKKSSTKTKTCTP